MKARPTFAASLALTTALVASAGSSAPAVAQPFKDRLVQAPSLAAPERGSVKGPLSDLAFAPSALARGGFTLPLPLDFPEERGPLQAAVAPSYSPDSGLSEWGMGWSNALTIERRKQLGEIDFASDDFMSPWGLLRAGSDGFFYPAGLASPVRLRQVVRSTASRAVERVGSAIAIAFTGSLVVPASADFDWEATGFDGTVYRFTAANGIATAQGSYSWSLSEIVSLEGDRTALTWQKNPSGRPFLSRITWAERNLPAQYELAIAYEPVPTPLTSHASGAPISLDQRARTVTVAARDATSGSFRERWHHTLNYRAAPFGPAFYLETIQRTFASGQSQPAMAYTYELDSTRLPLAQLQHYAGFDAVFAEVGDGAFQPDRSAMHDVDDDGRPDLELGADHSLIKQTGTGWLRSALPPASGTELNCRPSPHDANPPRTLARLTADPGEPHVLFTQLWNTAPMTSQVLVCDRLGRPLADLMVPSDWSLGPTVRLVDVDRDRRPDLVRVSSAGVEVLRNESTAQGFSFAPLPHFEWQLNFEPDVAWLNDFNGDGAIDIVLRVSDGLLVHHGLGQNRWDPIPMGMVLYTQTGATFGQLDLFEHTFLDANKDGLTDVLLNAGTSAVLFTNRGAHFAEVPVSGFGSIASEFGIPVAADLTGRGNVEVVFPTASTTYYVELANASTGLLASADDGAGTVARFAYKRSAPTPGFEHRITLLDKLTLDSSGYDPVSYTYAYGSPAAHSVSRQLLGFSSAERTSPYLVERVEFHNDDDVNGLVTRTKSTDGRSSLVRFADKLHQEASLAGVRFLRETSTTSGTRRGDGTGQLATTSTNEAFDRQHCATRVRSVTPSGTLITESILATVSALGDLPHCTVASTTLTGQHPTAALDFAYTAQIDRNSIGQPTRVRQTASGGELVLQDVSYDTLQRPITVQQPGIGAVTLRYDTATGLLREVVAPDGVVTSTRVRDPLTDALRELGIDRGAAPWVSSSAFDGQERLWKTWDDLGVASESQPELTLTYAFASATVPGRIQARSMIAPGSYRESVDLTSASGETLAALTRMPGGWQVDDLQTVDRNQLETRGFWRVPLADATNLATLNWPQLRSGATQLSFTRSAGGGQPRNQEWSLSAGVIRRADTSEAIVGDTVVTSTLENNAFTTQQAVDAAGVLRWKKDETGQQTSLTYDVLGRIVEVTLADGAKQILRYDPIGRVSSVGRPGLATVEYDYAPVTGLVVRKRIRDATGVVERIVEWTRDSIGRTIRELQSQPRRNATRELLFSYDGQLDGTTAAGQRGRLSRIAGPDFSRSTLFARDGEELSTSTSIGGWRTLEQSWTRYENSTLKDETWIVRDGQGQEISRLVQTNSYDAWGRLSEIRFNGDAFATVHYDGEGRTGRVDLTGGRSVVFHFDATTHEKSGYWVDANAWSAGVDWDLSPRGLIASEQITIDDATWERTHEYDSRKYLTRTHDSASESLSAYGVTGLATSMTDLMGARPITRSQSSIGTGTSATYSLDSLGRVTGNGELFLTWGASGEIEEASRGLRTWSYLYDEAGNRIGKREAGMMTAGYIGPIFLAEDRVVLPVKVEGQLIGTWNLRSSGNQFEMVATDPRGTLVAESGVPNLATPYGMRTQRPASPAIDYVEQGYDADLGTIRFGVRDYDPRLGQFWSPDPLFLEDLQKCASSPVQCNLYSYAGNNPVSYVDPQGTFIWVAVGVGLALIKFGGNANAVANDTPPERILPSKTTRDLAWDSAELLVSGAAGGGATSLVSGPITKALISGAVSSVAGRSVNDVRRGEFSGVQAYGTDALTGAFTDGLTTGAGVMLKSAMAKASPPDARPSSPVPKQPLVPRLGKAGGGAKLENISRADAQRIQNAADRKNQVIVVIGSRARGTAGPNSDWDYVMPGASNKTKHSLSSSLPTGDKPGIDQPRQLDIVDGYDPSWPHIIFTPRPK